MQLRQTLIALLVAACGAASPTVSPPPASPSAPASLAPAVTPTAVASAGPTPSDWLTIGFPGTDVGSGWIGTIEAVAITDSGMVGVGDPVCSPDDQSLPCHVSVWTSTGDGAWIRAADQAALVTGRGSPWYSVQIGMVDVAAGAAGVVAIGHPFDPAANGVWHSPNGLEWLRVPIDFGAAPGDGFHGYVSAVAANERGYVIVGNEESRSNPASARAAAWYSPDGITWNRAADTPSMDVASCLDTMEAPACGGMTAVAATPAGFVAVGHSRTGRDAEEVTPAAWTSPDGLTWARADSGLDVGGLLSGVAAGGPGLVAVGRTCLPDCQVPGTRGLTATSSDGATWIVQPVPDALPLRRVASNGNGIFALGEPGYDDRSPVELQLWQSVDGVSWLLVTDLPHGPVAASFGSMDIAAAPDGRVVVVGWAETIDGPSENFTYVWR